MVPQRRKQQPPDPPEDDEGESRLHDRTEISFGEGKTKISAMIGRNGRMLLMALSYAVFVLATMIGLSMLVKMLKDTGVLGCSIISLTFILTFGLAFVFPQLR